MTTILKAAAGLAGAAAGLFAFLFVRWNIWRWWEGPRRPWDQ